jgi:hypothetical protein
MPASINALPTNACAASLRAGVGGVRGKRGCGEASFDHLPRYSASYYTYLRSQTIAKDLLSAFTNGLLIARPRTVGSRNWAGRGRMRLRGSGSGEFDGRPGFVFVATV